MIVDTDVLIWYMRGNTSFKSAFVEEVFNIEGRMFLVVQFLHLKSDTTR